jgi:LuxR family maltose regulon positive regulatory protein
MDTRSPLPILFPKVQIPPSRLQLVSRQRLLKVLDAGLTRKLTLISAPAGYGKSTLLSEWAAGCERPPGWVTLEAGDNDIERFLAYLLSAVQTAGAGSASLENFVGARFPLQPLPLDVMLAVLVNQLPLAVERLVIVLDDYHHIENQEIHSFISALLDHLPPNIHLILSTRAEPPLRLARLRAKGQLNEISAGDLRFTLDERRLFSKRSWG